MALRNNFYNESGFPGISEDSTENRIKAVYEYGNTFSVDVTFWEESFDQLGVATSIPIFIDNFTFTPYDTNLKCVKKSNDTLTISGSIGETFKDAYYNFVMSDKSVKTLPMNTKENYLALVKWSPPSTKFKEVTHSIALNYRYTLSAGQSQGQMSVITTKTFSQGIYWSYSIGIGQFQTALSKGTI